MANTSSASGRLVSPSTNNEHDVWPSGSLFLQIDLPEGAIATPGPRHEAAFGHVKRQASTCRRKFLSWRRTRGWSGRALSRARRQPTDVRVALMKIWDEGLRPEQVVFRRP